MFIYRKFVNDVIKNNRLNKNNVLENQINDFYNNLIYPKQINHVISIYMLFDKEISEKEDLYVKSNFEKYIDRGFTNIMHCDNKSCLIVRFNIEYDILCEDILNIYNKLKEKEINIKCSVVYSSEIIDGTFHYQELKKYLTNIKNNNEIICSNYYEYLFQMTNK